MLVDATENVWERRWFVLRRYGFNTSSCLELLTHIERASYRPYLHMYKHSDELEEVAVVQLSGVNVERNPEMEALLGVRSPLYCAIVPTLTSQLSVETVYLHTIYRLKLVRSFRP